MRVLRGYSRTFARPGAFCHVRKVVEFIKPTAFLALIASTPSMPLTSFVPSMLSMASVALVASVVLVALMALMVSVALTAFVGQRRPWHQWLWGIDSIDGTNVI